MIDNGLIKPGQRVTKKDLQYLNDNIDSLPINVQQFVREMTGGDMERQMKIMNRIAANDGVMNSDRQYGEQGGIYIKPSKRGTFTTAAKRHGASVQEFASRVLANKDNYSPAMVKKAVFASNSSK